jgi:hypothetical protein
MEVFSNEWQRGLVFWRLLIFRLGAAARKVASTCNRELPPGLPGRGAGACRAASLLLIDRFCPR